MSQIASCAIRRLQQSDVPAILEIIRSVRQEHGLENRVATLLEPADFALFEVYRRRRAAYFVALVQGRIVGGAGISRLAGADWQTCELQRMYLRQESRQHGIGQALLDACLGAAQSFAFTHCYAETIREMATAIAFYERNGFKRLASAVGEARHAHTEYWMMRELHIPSSACGQWI